jgi:hypothetical protein
MAQKFYSDLGEKDHLSPRLQKISRESTQGCKLVYIPELRIHVFTKANETAKQTRERYLKNSISYGSGGKHIKADAGNLAR